MAMNWGYLLRYAPHLISLSRDLMQRSKQTPAPSKALTRPTDNDVLRERVAALEENERRQAELVEKMAEQQATLVTAIDLLLRQQRVLSIAVVVLAAFVGVVAWLALP